MKLLILALYERCRWLRDLAVEQEDSEQKKIMKRAGALFSDSASRMYLRALESANVEIPKHFRSSVLASGSLFHHCIAEPWDSSFYPLRKEYVLQDLCAAGFVHVGDIWDGITPLMTLQGVDIVNISDQYSKL